MKRVIGTIAIIVLAWIILLVVLVMAKTQHD